MNCRTTSIGNACRISARTLDPGYSLLQAWEPVVAFQRMTIAKLAGLSGELAFERLTSWAAARTANDPNEWSPEQWPASVRRAADTFADELRIHGCELPVCHFVEWSDLYGPWAKSLCVDCRQPSHRRQPQFMVTASKSSLIGCPTMVGWARHLDSAGPQQFPRMRRLFLTTAGSDRRVELHRPAVTADRLALRHYATVEDHEVTESLTNRANWLA